MSLFSFFTGSDQKKYADAAAQQAVQGYNTGYNRYTEQAGQGRDALNTNYGAGVAGYQPYAQAGQAGMGSYLDALGLNGADGVTRAQQQFQTSPGYQWTLDQGLNAVDRRAASRGMLGSGNTNIDTMKYAQQLGNQEWNNYLNRLQGLGTQGLNAAQGQGLLYANLGNALDKNYTGVGTQGYNAATGTGNALAGAEVAKSNAQTAADKNLWGAIMGGAQLAGQLGGAGGLWSKGGVFGPSAA